MREARLKLRPVRLPLFVRIAAGYGLILVVMLGIARRSDSPILFWEFTRKGLAVTAMSVSLAALYLWLRYFVLA